MGLFSVCCDTPFSSIQTRAQKGGAIQDAASGIYSSTKVKGRMKKEAALRAPGQFGQLLFYYAPRYVTLANLLTKLNEWR